VKDVPNFRIRLVNANQLHRRLLRPQFPFSHALSYTDFPGIVMIPAESECGASLHEHWKCYQAGYQQDNRDRCDLALEGGYTHLQRNGERLAEVVTQPLHTCAINMSYYLSIFTLESVLWNEKKKWSITF
jgi:hypothetical protein